MTNIKHAEKSVLFWLQVHLKYQFIVLTIENFVRILFQQKPCFEKHTHSK